MSNGYIATTIQEAAKGLMKARNWINGECTDSGKWSDSFDPATGQRIGTYADATLEDVQAATRAALNAFKNSEWKDDRHLRARIINEIADRFEDRRAGLIKVLSLENGKVRPEAVLEMDIIPSKFRYWASVVLTNYGRSMEVSPGHLSVVTRSPDRSCRRPRTV
jgi:betaine-aldehyde dehydrogenase